MRQTFRTRGLATTASETRQGTNAEPPRVQMPFCVPRFLLLEKDLSLLGLLQVPKGRCRQLLIRGVSESRNQIKAVRKHEFSHKSES